MNIFYIPSWYPSKKNPIYGTFVKEQVEMLARLNRDWNLGVSTWGQGDSRFQMKVGDHVKNLPKLFRSGTYHSDQQSNIFTYSNPRKTWTRKVLDGNLKGLLEANDENFQFFQKQVGRIDVLHAQATYPGALIANYLSGKYDIPYVVSIRMSPFPFAEFQKSDGSLKAWIETPLKEANKLICTSTSLEKRLHEFDLTNTQVIHNPVDTDFFKPIDFLPEQTTILTVGRMVPQKGIDILIRAIKELGDDFQGKFRIGGDGEHLREYQNLAKELGISDKITWLGELSREQVREEMQRCSFYVLPSRHETFGNVLLEAIACGKPVIAMDCGGPRDIVTEEVGVLCEADALTESLKQMISNYAEFTPTLKEDFTPDGFQSAMGNLYRVLASRK